MFLEFHGYIIDPLLRYLDLNTVCRDCPGWKQFGAWQTCEEGIRCNTGWTVITGQQCKYLLSQYPGLILEDFGGNKHVITWTGDPPLYGGCVIS